MYKQVNGVWNYVYELTDKAGTLITKSYPTKELIDVDYEIKISGFGRREGSSSSWSKRSVVDDVLVLGHVEDTHIIPLLNSNEDQYLYGSWKDVEYSAIVNIADNTILRHNVDGTVDKYDVVESIPIQYTDSDKTMLLLHCDDKTRSDSLLISSKRMGSITYNCDISTITNRLGTGSFSLNGINQNIVLNNSNSCFVYKNNYTLDFWVYLDELPVENNYGLALFNTENGYSSSNNNMISLEIRPNGLIQYCNYYYSESSNDRYSTLGSIPLKAKTWHRIALRLRKLADTSAYEYSFEIKIDDYNFVGKSQNFYNFKTIELGSNRKSNLWLKGYIDEVRLYDGSTNEFTPYEEVKGWVRL